MNSTPPPSPSPFPPASVLPPPRPLYATSPIWYVAAISPRQVPKRSKGLAKSKALMLSWLLGLVPSAGKGLRSFKMAACPPSLVLSLHLCRIENLHPQERKLHWNGFLGMLRRILRRLRTDQGVQMVVFAEGSVTVTHNRLNQSEICR